ncbi:hypothetical protein ACFV24_02540 [Nocardia fluminea]|uniref:hypothetical protein n=1 Tax=Nocardia fluminea TaxID=134984 RepID=UPI0036722C0C
MPRMPIVDVTSLDTIDETLTQAGLPVGRPVVVVVGGAGGLATDPNGTLARLLRQHIVPLVQRLDATVVDGGTDAGVMRIMGDARATVGATFPLIGVAARGTVLVPGEPAPKSDAAPLEPGHSTIILVPGEEWGDESAWIAAVATTLAQGYGSVTVLINGGSIAYTDVLHSLAVGRPVVVLAGTGRTADEIADAAEAPNNAAANQIRQSPLTTVISMAAPTQIAAAIHAGIDGAPNQRSSAF